MPIVSSQIVSQSVQQDGTTLVTERHADHTGRDYTHSYYAQPGADLDAILAQRANNLGAEIDKREYEAAEALNFVIPLKKDEFRNLYTAEEQAAVSLFYETYLTNTNLTDAQKAQIAAGIQYYRDVTSIYLTHPLTIASVQMHETLGLIAPGRAAQILAG